MTERTRLLYLEPDDEITSIVRRLREADGERVVLVASGRTKATSSAVALRLLAGVAADEGREIALVADPTARAIAAEAGIAGFASVADANAEDAVALDAPAPRRAPIHVVRGETPTVSLAPVTVLSIAPTGPSDETQAVALPRPARARVAARPRWMRRVALGILVALLVSAAAAGVLVLPAATIRVIPATLAVGPEHYPVRPPVQGPESDTLQANAQGEATGDSPELIASSGSAVFLNYSYVTVEIPEGTPVSASGDVFFTTLEQVIAPPGELTGGDPAIDPGEISVGVVASVAGAGGNVAAEAIDTVENRTVDRFLQGFPNQHGRRVTNPEATVGGAENHRPQVLQSDVDAVVADLTADLERQLAERLAADEARIYPDAEPSAPEITIPVDLVGRIGEESFELTGSMTFSRPYVLRTDAEAAAREALEADPTAIPAGTELLAASVTVRLEAASLDGAAIVVQATVEAAAAPRIAPETVRERAAGRTASQAEATLADLGEVSVELWPGWVDRVPGWSFRVKVEIAAPSASPAE